MTLSPRPIPNPVDPQSVQKSVSVTIQANCYGYQKNVVLIFIIHMFLELRLISRPTSTPIELIGMGIRVCFGVGQCDGTISRSNFPTIFTKDAEQKTNPQNTVYFENK